MSLLALESWMMEVSTKIPVIWYVFFGEVIEEILSPIPSQIVLLTAGSIAFAQGHALWILVVLTLVAALAKTVATMLYYVLGDKLEDVLVPRFGKYVGITHEDVESIGKRLDKGGRREFLSLFAIRCLPILPSAPVSLVCGVLKIGLRTFWWASFAGNLVRGGMMLLTGYLGFDVFEALLHGTFSSRTWLVLAIFLLIAGIITWGYIQRYRRK